MELIVGAFLVFGFLAILTRFITRDESGQIRLPRIVDDSIGMWALRRITGRHLWERGWYDDIPTERPVGPDASDPTAAALGSIAAASQADPTFGRDEGEPSSHVPARRPSSTIAVSSTPVHDLRSRLRERGHDAGLPSLVTPVFHPDGRRRYQARRMGLAGWAPRVAALGSVAAVLIVAVVALGAVILPRSHGAVLDTTGRPSATPSSQIAIAPGGAASLRVVSAPAPTATTPVTPRPTVRPTARPTAQPTPRPTPVPTPKPAPRPTPTPPPPVAAIHCAAGTLLVDTTCSGQGSARAASFEFDFGDGTIKKGTSSTQSHLYLMPGQYTVKVIVTDSFGRKDSAATTVTIA